MDWRHLLYSAEEVPWWGFILRTTILYFTLVICSRLTGRREISRLDPYSFSLAIVIGSIASPPLADPGASPLVAILGIFLLYALGEGLYGLELLNRAPISKAIGDEPIHVIKGGKIVEDNLMKTHYNLDNLLMQLRLQDAPNIHDVEAAILEPNGQLSVVKKAQKEAVTPGDLGLTTSYEGLPTVLIYDGKIKKDNLGKVHLTEDWLFQQLQQKGINKLQDVFLASIDTQGNLYVDFIRPAQGS